MNIGIFYIATSIYKEYFNKYFLPSLYNLFPNDIKNIIIISDEYLSFHNVDNCKFYFEDIIDFPYPIINLCKFQIIEKYAKKYNIDIILYFDADTIIFEKPLEFWNNLKQKCIDHKDKLILSYHPHYLYNINFNFNNEYFFPYIDGSCINVDTNIIKDKKCYMMTSFFMCYKDALYSYSKKIYNLANQNLKNLRWIPNLSDETYLNVINILENQSILLDYYITINPYIYGDYNDKYNRNIWKNNFENIDSIFINQKFDIEIKAKKQENI